MLIGPGTGVARIDLIIGLFPHKPHGRQVRRIAFKELFLVAAGLYKKTKNLRMDVGAGIPRPYSTSA